MLVAGAQIIGHCELWKRVFNLFDLQIDKNLVRHLTKKDENKNKRRAVQKTKEYKSYRSAKRYDKYAKAHTDQLGDMKSGAQYETGVAVATAKKTSSLPIEIRQVHYQKIGSVHSFIQIIAKNWDTQGANQLIVI